MSAPRLVLALLLACGSAPLAACDLDGLPGFQHRANPFARAPIFRGAPAAQPHAPAQEDQRADKREDRTQPTATAAPRSWERTDNPGPITPEDKAVFN
jgi:hypothetical protein